MKIFLIKIIFFSITMPRLCEALSDAIPLGDFVFQSLLSIFKSATDLVIENAVLRQQLISFKKQHPRPPITRFDRLFWVLIRMAWKKWKNNLVMVKPDTVVRWHRKLFKLFWKYKSRKLSSLEKALLKKEIRRMILKIVAENPSWGAPRIHGELLKLGFGISERTVSRIVRKHRGPERQKGKDSHWLSFLHNHRPALAAMDFFIVPTLFFKPLYAFFIINHEKRKIIHCHVTFHPTTEWVKTQLRIAFAKGHTLKYLICDRDSIFLSLVEKTMQSLGLEPIRTSYKSPWQNGIAERFIGSVRRELLDHVIIMNKRHLYALLQEYIDYYHHDRTHYALNKETPFARETESRPAPDAMVVSLPRLGGLHHRYTWKNVA